MRKMLALAIVGAVGFNAEAASVTLTSLFEPYRWPKLQKVFSVTPQGELKILPGFEYVVGEGFVAIPIQAEDFRTRH